VLDNAIDAPNAIAHVWKGNGVDEMAKVTGKGHYALLSSCWYLDYIKTDSDWKVYYKCDPQVAPFLSKKTVFFSGFYRHPSAETFGARW
jgi:hypothetical protein